MPMMEGIEGPSFGRGWGDRFDKQQTVQEQARELWINTLNTLLPSSSAAQAINAANQVAAAFRETFKQENT